MNFLGNARPLQGTLASVRSMVSGFAGTMAGILGAGVSIEAASEDIAAQKKLQAVLTATGYAAGLSAANIRELATDLQATTNFADETTVAAAAVLATFKSIKGDQFKDTLKTAQDLATVFDMDLQSATIKLGKALQDPISGIGSLHKVGISFTEQQKAMIKTLVDSGDAMGAQKYMLETLKGSFGGAAEAMASPFKILQNLMNDIGEEIGKSLLVPMKALAQIVIPFLKQWGSELAKVALAVLALVGVMKAISAVQKAVAIGQAMILALGGPAGWASLAAGAAVFAGGLALVNSQFGKMQGEMDAVQAKFAGLAEAAKGGLSDRLIMGGRLLGDKPEAVAKEDEKTRLHLNDEFKPKFLSDQLKGAADAFGGAGNVPWFVREGIIEKFTGAQAAVDKLKEEMVLLNGATQSDIEIAKLWKADNGLSVERRKELEALIRQRDVLAENKKIMDDMKSQAKQLSEGMQTPIEKAAKIADLFKRGLIDDKTFDRAMSKANEEAFGKDHKLAPVAFKGSAEAISAINRAQAGGSLDQQKAALVEFKRQVELARQQLVALNAIKDAAKAPIPVALGG